MKSLTPLTRIEEIEDDMSNLVHKREIDII